VIAVDQEAKTAAEAFGFSLDQNISSLSAYGAVYRLSKNDRLWVLKRTGYPHSNASSLEGWLRALSALGIEVVSPAEKFAPNPRTVHGARGDWVIYPYIEGSPYRGEANQIELAGRLLGQIHSAGADLGEDLLVKEHLPIHDDNWRQNEITKAKNLVSKAAPELAVQFEERLNQHVHCHDRSIDILSQAALPLAACSWDFKVSNLVFRQDRAPVLVDPDHGGRIPRLYDLACCALLFHCNCPTAPSRMFSVKEWSIFLNAYAKLIKLSDTEHQLWPDVLTAAWMDEGIWLIGNWPEGWSSPHDRRLLADLAISPLRSFGLDEIAS